METTAKTEHTIAAEEIYEVTIIGGGPAGLFSAFYSGLRELKTKVIEYHPYLGGKMNIYPEKMIWDIGGVPPQPAGKVIEHLVAQAEFFKPTIVTGEKIISLTKEDDLFVLGAESGAKHYSKTVIMAIGYGLLDPVKLTIEGAEKFEVTNLLYTVTDPASLKGKRVLISGGGNAAVDWANLLEPIAAEVHLSYRKEELKGHEAEVSKLLNSNVRYHKQHEIESLIADPANSALIERVVLKETQSGETQEIQVDAVVINHGFESGKAIFDQNTVGLKQIDGYYIGTNPKNATEIPGIFAAGDAVYHEGKLHLIAGAFHDACNAVNQAKVYLEPTAYASGMVSSHNDAFASENEALVTQFFG